MNNLLDSLSVLIVTWNGDGLLQDCLQSLHRACGGAIEIVVVDNANLQSTKAVVERFENAKYLASKNNLGFAGGNNLGLPLCTREYVLLLNNDTIIHEEPFSQMIRYMKAHPSVAVTQGKMRLSRVGDVLDTCGSLQTPWGVIYDEYVMADSISTKPRTGPVLFAKGACLMFRRSVVEKTGGFLFYDFFGNNYEEADFCHRVWLAGFEVHFVDTPIIDHLQGQSIRRLNQVSMNGRSFANMWFSLSVNLEPKNWIMMALRISLLQFSILIYKLVTLKFGDARSIVYGYGVVVSRLLKKSSARLAVAAMRRRCDCEILSRIFARPKWQYYLYALRGVPRQYFEN